MSNHVAKIHGIKKVVQKVSVLPQNNVVAGHRNIIQEPSKIVVTDREIIDYETVYAPICTVCEREIKGGVFEGYSKGLLINGKYTKTEDFHPDSHFICDDCFYPSKYSVGYLALHKNTIDAGDIKFEKVSFNRVMEAVRNKTALIKKVKRRPQKIK
jgi:hypothetical protein